MNKSLLVLMASAALTASSAYAVDFAKAPFSPAKVTNQPARAATADGFDIDFCGDLTSWYALIDKSSVTYKCYIHITPEVATQLAGNQLTDITFSFASQNSAAKRTGSIFVAEDLAADPVTSTDITVINAYVQEIPWQTAALETPYTIKENTGFYIGYIVKNCKYSAAVGYDYPVGITETVSADFAGGAEVTDSRGTVLASVDMAKETGYSLFIKAKTVGEKKSVNNVFSFSGFTFGPFAQPIVPNAENPTVYASIQNFGSNPIQSITYRAQSGDNVYSGTQEINVDPAAFDIVELPLPAISEGYGKVTLELGAINGIPMKATATLPYFGIAGNGYPKKFVAEEGTGTWCGWCPRGIVSFDQLEKKYPDNFIGIAVHYDDNMAVASYQPLLQEFFEGFPSCIINRDPNYNVDPNPEDMEYYYQVWDMFEVAPAKITLEADEVVDKTLKVRAYTTFDMNMTGANFALAFVVLENGIAGRQTNYYSGGNYGEMGGWEKYGSTQSWAYKHVARNIFDCWGIKGSVPTTVVKGENYCYEYEVSLSNVAKVENSSIVALLLDATTGIVLNAEKIKATEYGQSAINDVTRDNNADVEYYNLQGVRMQGTNLPAGIYITRQGQKTGKVIIR